MAWIGVQSWKYIRFYKKINSSIYPRCSVATSFTDCTERAAVDKELIHSLYFKKGGDGWCSSILHRFCILYFLYSWSFLLLNLGLLVARTVGLWASERSSFWVQYKFLLRRSDLTKVIISRKLMFLNHNEKKLISTYCTRHCSALFQADVVPSYWRLAHRTHGVISYSLLLQEVLLPRLIKALGRYLFIFCASGSRARATGKVLDLHGMLLFAISSEPLSYCLTNLPI